MTEARVAEIAESLRGRILRGVEAGTLEPGERLPSARDLADEFAVDHRIVIAAYRTLADDDLVEVRERGGIYVSARPTPGRGVAPPARWLVDLLTDAFSREVAPVDLHEWLRRATQTLRLRAVVLSTTEDQTHGLARELRDDFGLEAEGVVASTLPESGEPPAALRHADVIVTTSAHVALAERLGASLQKPVVPVDVRPDLVVGEWALLLRRPVWAIVATPEFGEMLRRFFASVEGIENLHILVHGRDDLDQIPDGAPTYITHRVRARLGDTPIRGRVLPAARTISTPSARALFAFIVRANLDAVRAVAAARVPPGR